MILPEFASLVEDDTYLANIGRGVWLMDDHLWPAITSGCREHIANPKGNKIATAQLAVDGQVKHCPVTDTFAECRWMRVAQMSFSFSGGFYPISLPLFQGSRIGRFPFQTPC
jgi:hypothetical protein